MITRKNLSATILIIILNRANCLTSNELILNLANIPEDGRLQFCELANKYGYKCIRYNVSTEDGYILGLFNIPGDKRRVVYLQHGFVDSSDTFLIRTNLSLVAYLAKEGYDVWLGNMRGNMHSRAHKTLDPDGVEFWEFSIHEIGIYDMPAMIDFVLNKTGEEKLQVIAQSEGTTAFFVLGSIRPEYSTKLKVVICLAPIAFLHYAEKPIFPLVSTTVGSALNQALSVLGHGELLGNSSPVVRLIKIVCSQNLLGYAVCAEGFIFPFFGRDPAQFEPEFLRVVIGHFPSSSSYKNLIHLQQFVDRRQFAQYDYGILKNMEIYNSAQPPIYDLRQVRTRIALVVGLSDRLADITDVGLLREQLPNVVDYHVMERKEWNHIDFMWGNNMSELFGYINGIMIKYFD